VPHIETCPGCGVTLPTVEHEIHKYMRSSASCFARFGELLADDYADPARMQIHQIVVDAFAVQHPGNDIAGSSDYSRDPRSIQSVGIHLMTLCLFIERGVDPALGPQIHRQMVERPVFEYLERPASMGRLTVADVNLGSDFATAKSQIYAWGESAWIAWVAHHNTVRGWLETAGF
jgi:Family of unknown function (DUF5946)